MYLLQLYLVPMETFEIQRSRSSPPSMVYTTLENTLDQQEMEAIWNESRDKHPRLGQLKSIAKEAKPKPYGDFFAELSALSC